eukprot:8853259-Prorocentrum_lima.AAC.1
MAKPWLTQVEAMGQTFRWKQLALAGWLIIGPSAPLKPGSWLACLVSCLGCRLVAIALALDPQPWSG